MSMRRNSADLIVRNALLRGEAQARDLFMSNGKYVSSEEDLSASCIRELDAGGKLCIPSFIDPHIHLDKAHTIASAKANHSGTLAEAIKIGLELKRNYTCDDLVKRAGQTIVAAVSNGVTHLRTHVDVDNVGGLLPLEAIVEARNIYSDIVDLQIVAFPQEGLLRNKGTVDLMWRAMEEGADVVGGMPLNEDGTEESAKHIQIAFEIAKKFNADIDMHVDETDDPSARTLEILACHTITNDWQGRVTAGHTCALAAYPDDYADRVIQLVKDARIHMVTNPATNLMLQGRHDNHPKRRGITRVKELLAQGINVSFGQDNLRDVFYPFGRNDPLEIALLTAHAAHMSSPKEIEQIFDMPTINAAGVVGLDNYGTNPGSQADLVVLDAYSPAEAITLQAGRRYIIKRGRLVVETETRSKMHWSPESALAQEI